LIRKIDNPGLSEAIWVKLRSHVDVVQHGVTLLLGFGGRDVSDRLEQARLLNQSTHSSVAYPTASKDRHGLRRWITSAL
jgi:hypothetical protein